MVTSSSATQGKTHWAIAIGIGQYPLLPPLTEAQANAVAVAAAWQAQPGEQPGDQYRSIVLSDRSLPLMDRPTYPNRENLEYWLDYATTELVQPGDYFWCFFSGYGVNQRDRDYLLPIEASLDRVAAAGVPLRRVCEYLKLAGDRVGATGRVLLVLDLSRPPLDTLPPAGGEIPLLAQEMGVSIVLAEPGAGRQSSGLLAPALVTALGQSQGMNLYALSRFLRDTTGSLAQQHGSVAPQIRVFAHPHERLYETVVGRSRPAAPPPIESFVVFPASPAELEPSPEPEAPAIAAEETAVFGNDQVTSPVLDSEALDRFAAAASVPDAWATEPSAFEALFAPDWVPESSNGQASVELPPASVSPREEPIDREPPVTPPIAPPVTTVAPSLPPIGPPPEPIPESQRDLATATPIAPGPAVSPGSDPFARQLVLWSGAVGIALLAGVVARNYAAFFGARVDAPPPVATPLPAPSNGAAPPTGTLVPPPPQKTPAPPAASPQPTPVAKPVAASPIAPPATPANGAQLVQSAKAAMAVGQFQQALNLLAKVPANAQTPEIQALRSEAVQGRDRNLLGLARVPIGTNQASEFGKAILRARQIKAGDPGYDQAQQAIDRWSRVILDLAKGRAQNGDFTGAIAAAKLVAADRGEVYTEAKGAIGQWQTLQKQQANNRAILQKAASQIKGGQASTYNRAIDLARAVPPTQPGYAAARDQIDLWSREILNIAQARARSNQFAAAIQTAGLVPPNTAAHGAAQQAIAQWRPRVRSR